MTVKKTDIKALVFNLQRFSTEDGPGIRTTAFFKGCPLHCAWCHNPESISPQLQVYWVETRCIACLSCIQACPQQALSYDGQVILINRSLCDGCGKCAEVCPTNAWELLGVEYQADDLALELEKDRVFFESSDGGVTLSGGDPILQHETTLQTLKKLMKDGIQTALDTCGLCDSQELLALLEYTDLLLYDLKLADDSRHRHFTGSGNTLILENLKMVAEYIHSHSGRPRLWIRTPLIPGATADKENINALGSFIAANLGDVLERWELCAFNNLCRDKYMRLGLEWEFAQTPLLSKEELQHWVEVAKASGVDPQKVTSTGVTRLEG